MTDRFTVKKKTKSGAEVWTPFCLKASLQNSKKFQFYQKKVSFFKIIR